MRSTEAVKIVEIRVSSGTTSPTGFGTCLKWKIDEAKQVGTGLGLLKMA